MRAVRCVVREEERELFVDKRDVCSDWKLERVREQARRREIASRVGKRQVRVADNVSWPPLRRATPFVYQRVGEIAHAVR